jgi:hypothetical protein
MSGNASWFEVWADDSVDPPYLLLVRPDPNDKNRLTVCDPKEGYRVVHHDEDYESLRFWLLEDEYTLVRGRTEVE